MTPSYQTMHSSSFRGTRSPEPAEDWIGIMGSDNAKKNSTRGTEENKNQLTNHINKEHHTMNASTFDSYEDQESARISYNQLPRMNSHQKDQRRGFFPPASAPPASGAPPPANYSSNNHFSSSFMMSTNNASRTPGLNVHHHPAGDEAINNADPNQPYSSHFSGQKFYNTSNPFVVFSGNYYNNQPHQQNQQHNSNVLGYPQLNHHQQDQHFNQYHSLAQQQNIIGASASAHSSVPAAYSSTASKPPANNNADTNRRVLTRSARPPISSTTSIAEKEEGDHPAARPLPRERENRARTESIVSNCSERSTATTATTNPKPEGDAKKKRTRKKKPKDSPRRPLSAYNFFFKDERKRILQAIPVKQSETSEEDRIRDSITWPGKKKAPHGKIGFESLAKTIGARWKKLDKKSMKYYKALATKDLHRYAAEMVEYDAAKHHQTSSKRTKVDEQQEEEEDVNAMVSNAGTSNFQKKAKKDKTRSPTKQNQFVNVDEIDPVDDPSMAMDIHPSEAFNCHQHIIGEAEFFSSNLDREKLGSILSGINFGDNENDDDLFTFSKSESAGDDYA